MMCSQVYILSNLRRFIEVLNISILIFHFSTNCTSLGGISSYALCLMCINFLQMRAENTTNEDANLGVLLVDFLELYGQKFDYNNTGISIRNGGKYVQRKELPCGLVDGQYRLFCVEDAINPWLNACSVSYRASDVKKAFYDAFSTLSSAVQNDTNDGLYSMLGRIVHVTDDFLQNRNWIQEHFGHAHDQ